MSAVALAWVHALEATSDEGSHMSSVVIWFAFILLKFLKTA